jgi:hypothetical protein
MGKNHVGNSTKPKTTPLINLNRKTKKKKKTTTTKNKIKNKIKKLEKLEWKQTIKKEELLREITKT